MTVQMPAVAQLSVDRAVIPEGPECGSSPTKPAFSRASLNSRRITPPCGKARSGDRPQLWDSFFLSQAVVGVLFPGTARRLLSWAHWFDPHCDLEFLALPDFHRIAAFNVRMATELRMFSAGVAMMAGAGLVFAEFVNDMSTDSARLLLGFGVILIGASGLLAAWYLPERNPNRLITIVVNCLVVSVRCDQSLSTERGSAILRSLDVADGGSGHDALGLCRHHF